MTKFEKWLVRLIDHLDKRKRTSDRVFKVVYEFGHDIALEILHTYRRLEKGDKN
jgi:hypothetical protein